jgi:DNA-binding response OmpR family regulator
MPRVLIVEDDDSMRDMVGYALADEGMEIEAVADGESALEVFSSSGPFDLVVLDVMLPGVDGITVCKELTSASDVPVIMLTARDDEMSVVVGLEVGADDYITKPFSMREFRSRVRAALRRAEMVTPADAEVEPLRRGDIEIDFAKRTTEVRGQPIDLTFVEFEILSALARHPGRVFPRDSLLESVWGDSAYRDPRTIDVHIRHLREKIERDPKSPEYLLTVRGVGYRFRDE